MTHWEPWRVIRVDCGPFKFPYFTVARYAPELKRWEHTFTPSRRPRRFRERSRAEAFAEKLNA